MSKYYYLVAGLPELTLEDSKLSYTVADFKTELYPALSEDDKKLIDLFYLKFDNANVLKLLKDKDAAIDPRGNYSSEELVEYISQLKDGDEVSDSVFPSYLSTFISEYFSLPAEDGLDGGTGGPGKETGPASLGLDGGGHILRLLYRGTSVCLPATAGDDRTVDFVG